MIITQEMALTMLMDSKLIDIFWRHAMHTIVHIQNRVILKNNNDKTPYELWKERIDNNLYIKVTQGNILLIEIYVDDIFFGSTNDRLSQKFANDMKNEFEISLLGELSFFLGLQIQQRNQGIFISQTKYIREMLKRFGMEYCKPIITPMQTSCKLRKDDDSKSIDHRQYRSIIGSLLYVIASRLDVMQVVGQVAQFQATPKESHVLAVKRIFRYLKGTEEFGLWYPKGKDISLISYRDVDWVGFIDDR
jgi:hypothetical protein